VTGAGKLIRGVTVAAVACVGLVAAVLSYRHQFELAAGHGEPALTARLLPLLTPTAGRFVARLRPC